MMVSWKSDYNLMQLKSYECVQWILKALSSLEKESVLPLTTTIGVVIIRSSG